MVFAKATAAGIALAAVFALVGCGGSSESDATPTPSVTAPPTASPTSTPEPLTPTATEAGLTFEYEIQPGDSVAAIADRYGTTVEAIVAANGLADPAAIVAGQTLIIPGADSTPIPTPSPTPEPENAAGTGFSMPIAGGCLATDPNLVPNAPREYRFGTHEGMDFYSHDNCVPVPGGAEVLAVKNGTVTRADHGFVEMTAAELAEILTRVASQGFTDDDALDTFRGRQVWVDHGGGVVTRYAHLGAIPGGIQVGSIVSQGEVVGLVGDSGTPEAVTDPGIENHLHLEIRIGDSYLGTGLPEDQVRFLYEQVFSSS